MATATFDYAQFAALFPELADGGVTEPVASSFFLVAGLLFDNSDCSPVQDVPTRLVFLNYVVAHLASLAGYPLAAGATGPVASGMVGRVSKATEGTVSVESDYGTVSASAAYWLQTPYGATFWQLSTRYRKGRYVPAPPRYFGPAVLGGFARPGDWRN